MKVYVVSAYDREVYSRQVWAVFSNRSSAEKYKSHLENSKDVDVLNVKVAEWEVCDTWEGAE
ncbi:hypothetical protein C0966_00595 [Bacillus methanolicus]|uniref:DUF7336 domain-containing protein n=1 Tax=Bacillus methanolicus TaxID=1471 RepID=UPI00237FF494|nr:hypothetical protein [Bacillus methanolicus]MDE3837907.1 hypothetical protein [Bacillus methanolicus]